MKYIYLLIVLVFVSCNNSTVVPKPNAFLKLNYPNTTYQQTKSNPFYSFQHSNQSKFIIQKNGWANVYYPKLKAEISITYQPIKNNLRQLSIDAEKLTYKHTLKADNIEAYPFENVDKKVYARLFMLSGDVASPIQFQATDSIKHFLYGSLYFNSRPNYDSILPAINHINKDIKKLVETLEWAH